MFFYNIVGWAFRIHPTYPLRVVKGVLKEELACGVGYQNSPNVPLRVVKAD